jgi:predicted glutamine amidotransferase
VIKPKGKEMPSKKILRNCWENNPDGAGMMYVKDGHVVIDKGYMEFSDFWKAFRALKLTKNDIIVFHFRWATAGTIEPGNCHPFPLSDDVSDLKALDVLCPVAVAHNGMIGNGENDLSDTMVFVRDFLADPAVQGNLDSEAILALITRSIGPSRMIFLDVTEKIILLGEGWIKDHGLIYSNDRYKVESQRRRKVKVVNSRPGFQHFVYNGR